MSEPSTHNISEWYGLKFDSLSTAERKRLASISSPNSQDCPFSDGPCNKKGGVCSIRAYSWDAAGICQTAGKPCATCPRRLQQNGIIAEWVGSVILDSKSPSVVSEVPFLTGRNHKGEDTGKSVGKIDMVLLDKRPGLLKWCAVEIQAVYFSGDEMGKEFKHLKTCNVEGIPIPQGKRRPDFRSSGPKRLMPQLQTKVPTLSRWGHKMAVIIDQSFWESLAPMDQVPEISNCDIAWFVLDFEEQKDSFTLKRGEVHYTTLNRAIEGLTAGKPVALSEFENQLAAKVKK